MNGSSSNMGRITIGLYGQKPAFDNFLLTLLYDKQGFGIFLKGNAH